MIDVNPQQVLILAQEKIAAGWIQGQEQGYGQNRPGEDPRGVCMVGALRDAVGHVLRPQIIALCEAIPEYVALDAAHQEAFVLCVLDQYGNDLISIFRARFAQLMPSYTIEGWNDKQGRTKAQVLNAMKLALEIVTKECVAEWDQQPKEKPEPKAEAVLA